jgi:hypothetical protein
MVRDTPPYGHAPTYQISLTYLERQKSYGLDKLHWEEAEEEEQIRLKQYVSLRSKGRQNKRSVLLLLFYISVTVFINDHNSYSKMSVQQSQGVRSWAVLFT